MQIVNIRIYSQVLMRQPMGWTVCYKSAAPVPVVSARALARNLLRR